MSVLSFRVGRSDETRGLGQCYDRKFLRTLSIAPQGLKAGPYIKAHRSARPTNLSPELHCNLLSFEYLIVQGWSCSNVSQRLCSELRNPALIMHFTFFILILGLMILSISASPLPAVLREQERSTAVPSDSHASSGCTKTYRRRYRTHP